MLKRHVLLPALLLILPGFEAASAVGGCPPSTIDCDGVTTSTDAIRSVRCDDWKNESHGSAGHDLVLGRVQAYGSGQDVGGNGGVKAADDYTIVGLPIGTPAGFRALLRVTGSVYLGCGYGPSGGVFAALTEGASNRVEVGRSFGSSCPHDMCCAYGGDLDSILVVNVASVAGTPFRLNSEVGAYSRFGSARVTGQLSFEGLPPGASIVSCQGYRQDFPVPARMTSWGGFKVRYR